VLRVLLTGSSGFIGRYVQGALVRRGHQVLPFDVQNDIRDPVTVGTAMAEAEAVINLAGVLGTPELFGAEARAAEVNILGAINVYDAARDAGIPVVQIGTGHKGQPNPYAITKACAEDLGLARAQWCGEKIAIVRAYHVYGAGQIPGPPHGQAKVHKFFPTFACRALQRMPLELCGGGSQLVDPVHASDVAEVLADAVGGPYGAVTEAGCGKGVAVSTVAVDIAEAAGREPFREDLGYRTAPRPGEPPDAEVVASVPACQNAWPHLVSETVDWYRQWLAALPS